MLEKRNDCVQCPQGCIKCSRYKDYYVMICDNCNEEIFDLEKEFNHLGKKTLCNKCYEKEVG